MSGRGDGLVRVVLFTGGRGSDVLSKELIRDPRVRLTLAINGYDDGKSTGEVRRFLETSLGPSDFRKNAHRLARELGTCPVDLISLLDHRFPEGSSDSDVLGTLRSLVSGGADGDDELSRLARSVGSDSLSPVAARLETFRSRLDRERRSFSFADCSLGNLVFAGGFLRSDGDFNSAVADYGALLHVPPGIIENVTDGGNAYLVGLDRDNRLLASEAEIVEGEPHRMKDIFLTTRPPTSEEREALAGAPVDALLAYFEEHAADPGPNPTILDRLRQADLIVYAPGTQHSSLYPSYMTAGLGPTIAQNLHAVKLLITNIQEDVESRHTSAVEIIDRAVFYLRQKDRTRILAPCLVTHYLVNDPQPGASGVPYLSLGSIDTLEDPRLLRIGHFEDGASGRHSATKIITPFMRTIGVTREPLRVGILLLETDSLNKISQTILELVRGRIEEAGVHPTVFHHSPDDLPSSLVQSLPFPVSNVFRMNEPSAESFARVCRQSEFDYIVLFESSGMYRGEDIVNVVSHVTWGRLDAVWGSRRLSPTEIHESYRFRYRRNPILGAFSYTGSHLLSLAYLVLYGRYVTDTLSGVRAVRGDLMREEWVDLADRRLNQRLLSRVLGAKGEIFETPVQFLPLSPGKVRRTSVAEGLLSLGTVLAWRIHPRGGRS